MSRSRSSYEPKARAERQEYFKNTIRRQLEPTIEDSSFDTDSTDVEAPPAEPTRRPYTPTRRPSPLSVYLKDHWPTILVTAVLIPVLAFLLYQLFVLNREVGELKIRLDESHQHEERLEKQIDKLDDKLNPPPGPKEKTRRE